MRLQVSARTRVWLIGLTAICAVAWAALTALEPGHPFAIAYHLGWVLMGAALVLVVAAHRARRPEDECSFCHWPRANVKLLVAGPAVSICDGCVALAMAVVAEDLRGKQPAGQWQRMALNALPGNCPVKVSRPLLEAMAAASGDFESHRAVARSCRDFQSPDLACEMLERIPEADRIVTDWLDLGHAQGLAGHYAEAVAANATALNKDDGTWRPWCLNNGAWYGLLNRPDAPADVRAAWLRDLEEAKRLLAAKSPAVWQPVMQSFHGTEAELLRAQGDVRGALAALTEAERLGPLGGKGHLIRARVLAGSEPPLGRHDAEKAVELLHADSLAAGEARALLAKLTGAPAPG